MDIRLAIFSCEMYFLMLEDITSMGKDSVYVFTKVIFSVAK